MIAMKLANKSPSPDIVDKLLSILLIRPDIKDNV